MSPSEHSSVLPTVLVYRDRLLAASETFVLAQGESLVRHRAVYVGSGRVPGQTLPAHRSFVLNQGGLRGRAREVAFKLRGRSRRLEKWALAQQPRILHAHFGPDGAVALPLAQRLKLPMIVTFHGYDATTSDDVALKGSYSQRLYVRQRPRLVQSATRILAVSSFIRERLIEKGFSEDRTLVHYIGVDVDLFRAERNGRRRRQVLFVGRLVPVKGVEFLIRAMRMVRESVADAELLIVGDGPLKSSLEELASREFPGARFLGHIGPERVRNAMKESMVFCGPSITTTTGQAEAFGLVFAEAQAMGLPVVSSRSGGIPEAVAHGETGLLVPEGDIEHLAASLTALLTNTQQWNSFSDAAVKRVRERFSLSKQSALLEEIYDEVDNARLAR